MKLILRGCDVCNCPNDMYGSKRHRASCIQHAINQALTNSSFSKGFVLNIDQVQELVTAVVFNHPQLGGVCKSNKTFLEERDFEHMPRIELACTRLVSLSMLGRLDDEGNRYMKELIGFVNSMHRCYRSGITVEVAT